MTPDDMFDDDDDDDAMVVKILYEQGRSQHRAWVRAPLPLLGLLDDDGWKIFETSNSTSLHVQIRKTN